MPDNGFRYELIAGELKKTSPAGAEHGAVTVRLTLEVGAFVRLNQLGQVLPPRPDFGLPRTRTLFERPTCHLFGEIVSGPKVFRKPISLVHQI